MVVIIAQLQGLTMIIYGVHPLTSTGARAYKWLVRLVPATLDTPYISEQGYSAVHYLYSSERTGHRVYSVNRLPTINEDKILLLHYIARRSRQ